MILIGVASARAASITDLSNAVGAATTASFINNNGDIAGYFGATSNATQAFFYSGLTASITKINTLGGFPAYPGGLNASGLMVGYSFNGSNAPRAFLFSGSQTPTDLGTLGGTNSWGTGINDSGEVIGFAYDNNGNTRGFLQSCGGGTCSAMQEIGTLNGSQSEADYVNNAGNIAGKANSAGDAHQYAFYSVDGSVLNPIVLPSGSSSTALGMNAAGQVIGQSTVGLGVFIQHGFLYTPGATPILTDLGTFNGTRASSKPTAINDFGEVVGQADTSTGFHAFSCVLAGTTCPLTDLGTLNGITGNSTATDVNSLGYIIGTASTATGGTDPFIWIAGQMIDLNTLLPSGSGFSTLLTADAINDNNVIIGTGLLKDGITIHTYILNVNVNDVPQVPEPSTVALIALGLTGGVVYRRRKR